MHFASLLVTADFVTKLCDGLMMVLQLQPSGVEECDKDRVGRRAYHLSSRGPFFEAIYTFAFILEKLKVKMFLVPP